MKKFICQQCGIEFIPKDSHHPNRPPMFCSRACIWIGRKHTAKARLKISQKRKGKYKGSENPHWKGGSIIVGGYRYIHFPSHPNATKDGYVCEHRLVMEKTLNRYLKKKEVVHHINRNKLDNHSLNLVMFNSTGIHIAKEHPQQRDSCGRFKS